MSAHQGIFTRLFRALFRLALRLAAPSLAPEDREGAVETFRELAQEARERGGMAYPAFLAREARGLLVTFSQERRRRGRMGGDSPRSRGFTGRGLARAQGCAGDGPGEGNDKSRIRGRMRAGLGSRLVDVVRQDLGYAVRNLTRSPGFVAVSLLSLTFGIGVSTGLFSVVNAVLFRPLPYAEAPGRLVRVFSGTRESPHGPISYPDFEDLREATTTLADVALVRDANMILGSASGGTRQRWGLEVSENYFQLLGIPLARGRGFLPGDVAEGGRVVVIGYHLWQDMFDGDRNILGRTLEVNGHRHTIVGVGPEGMVGVEGPAMVDVAVPLMEGRENRGRASSTALGRMKEGVTLEQVQAELDALSAHLRAAYPEYWASDRFGVPGLRVMTLRHALLPPGPKANLVAGAFLAVVGLILLIACSNVANLLLTRALKRREEVAIRAAVGASGRRIVAQLLTENLVLFALAGVLSAVLIEWLASLAAAGTPLLPAARANIQVDGRVALFVAGVVLTTGLTFGLAPVLQASRPNLIWALKGREAPPRFRLLGMRNLLVGAQVGGSLLLVLVSLLLAQSLSYANRLDLGFDDEGVAVLELNLTYRDYDEARGRTFLRQLLQRAGALPGVSSAALASGIPLRGVSTYLGDIEPEGYDPAPGEWVDAGMNIITPEYLNLVDLQVLRGRGFSPEDGVGGEPVLLVSQAFVDRYWPGESGVGKLVRTGQDLYRVVGVVEDIPWRMPGEEPYPFLWIPFEQYYDPHMALHVRTSGDPGTLLPALRSLVGELDPDMPIVRLDRMTTLTANATQLHRVLSAVLGAAGIITLGLAMLGIYGIVSFSVGQRTREVGLRVALGAEPGRVVRMVLGEGMTLALVGLVPGLLLSLAAAHMMRAILMGLQPLDPVAFGTGVGLLLLSVAGASWLPARRAARCDPMRALREE